MSGFQGDREVHHADIDTREREKEREITDGKLVSASGSRSWWWGRGQSLRWENYDV